MRADMEYGGELAVNRGPLHPERIRAVLRSLDGGDDVLMEDEIETVRKALQIVLKFQKGVGLTSDAVDLVSAARDVVNRLGKISK